MRKTTLITLLILLLAKPVLAQFENYKWEPVDVKDNFLPREEGDFINVNGKFYLIGGRKIQDISVFDPQTSTWTKASKPPIELHHFQAVVYHNEIYVCCGMTDGYPHEKPLANFYIYNPEADSWRLGAAIPEGRQRGSGGALLYKGNFYFVCGILDGHWTGNVAWFDEYDPKTNKWKKLADAPIARDHFRAAIVGHKLYCIGGGQSNAKDKKGFAVEEVDVYDFKTEKWSMVAAKFPVPRSGNTMVVVKDKILLIGGESNTQKVAHNEVDAFDTKTATFIKLPPLITGRHAAGSLYFERKIFTVAGVGNAGGAPLVTTLECFNNK